MLSRATVYKTVALPLSYAGEGWRPGVEADGTTRAEAAATRREACSPTGSPYGDSRRRVAALRSFLGNRRPARGADRLAPARVGREGRAGR